MQTAVLMTACVKQDTMTHQSHVQLRLERQQLPSVQRLQLEYREHEVRR